MKKIKYIVFVLLLLSSCGETPTSVETPSIFSSEIVESLLEISFSESINSTLESSSELDSVLPSIEEVSTSTLDSSITKEETSVEVDFTNIYSAVKVDDHPEYLEDMLKDIEILSDYSFSNIYYDMGALKLGSAKSGGNLTLNFSIEIKKVEVTAKVYTKYVSYGDYYNVDETHLLINESKISFVIPEASDSEYESKEMDVHAKTIKLQSNQNDDAISGGYRIIISKMKICY